MNQTARISLHHHHHVKERRNKNNPSRHTLRRNKLPEPLIFPRARRQEVARRAAARCERRRSVITQPGAAAPRKQERIAGHRDQICSCAPNAVRDDPTVVPAARSRGDATRPAAADDYRRTPERIRLAHGSSSPRVAERAARDTVAAAPSASVRRTCAISTARAGRRGSPDHRSPPVSAVRPTPRTATVGAVEDLARRAASRPAGPAAPSGSPASAAARRRPGRSRGWRARSAPPRPPRA